MAPNRNAKDLKVGRNKRAANWAGKAGQAKVVKEKRKKYTEESLNRAITTVKNGVNNTRKAAREFGVPASTLCRRINSPRKDSTKSGPPTILKEDEEERIVNWMMHRSKAGCPITKDELLDSVQSYLQLSKRDTKLKENRPGRRWFEGFMKRHPNVSVRKTQNLTVSRANVTEQELREWFQEIRTYLIENNLLNIPASNIFNCDETSVELRPAAKKVFAEKGARAVYNVVGGFDKEYLKAYQKEYQNSSENFEERSTRLGYWNVRKRLDDS